MVVSTPDFDPDLDNHAAVEHPEGSQTCHALLQVNHSMDGPGTDVTECGIELGRGDPSRGATREVYAERDFEMCEDCWPAHVHGDEPENEERG